MKLTHVFTLSKLDYFIVVLFVFEGLSKLSVGQFIQNASAQCPYSYMEIWTYYASTEVTAQVPSLLQNYP